MDLAWQKVAVGSTYRALTEAATYRKIGKMVTTVSKIRRVTESVVSFDPGEQAAYEQIVIDYQVTYRTVFEIACMGFDIATIRKICKLAIIGYDPITIARAANTMKSCETIANSIKQLADTLNNNDL